VQIAFSNFYFAAIQKRVVNDFVIPNKNEQTAEQHRGRHF